MHHRRRRLTSSTLLALLLAGCGTGPILPPGDASSPAGALRATSGPNPVQPPPSSPAAAVQAGARLRVAFEGKPPCDSQFVCTARLSVLPDGTDLAATPAWEPANADALWQSVGEQVLAAPPDGDLPVLSPGAHVVVWSVSSARIVTDPPAPLPSLASRCTARVVVAPASTLVTIRVRFGGPSKLAEGSAACTLTAEASGASLPPTAAPISGEASLPSAALPAGWRKVASPDLSGLGGVGRRIVLGVAPDGAFIAIVSADQRDAALVLRSADGDAWTVAGTLPDSQGVSVMRVVGNGHAIVAAGAAPDASRPAVWTSPDGLAWARLAATSADGLRGAWRLAANSAGFVAPGGMGAAPWISDDPATAWHHVGSLAANPDSAMSDVAATDSGFVGVGWARAPARGPQPSGAGPFTDARAWLSPDGRDWTPTPVGGGEGQQLSSVAGQGSRVVAFGERQWPDNRVPIFVSADGGRTWARAAGPGPDSSCCGLVATAGGFLATTYTVWTSSDGASWSDAAWARDIGPATSSFRQLVIAASGPRVVAALLTDSAPPSFYVGTAP